MNQLASSTPELPLDVALRDGPRGLRMAQEETSRALPGPPGRGGLWPAATRSVRGFPGRDRTVDGQEEAAVASPLLEDVRRRLVRALQLAVSLRSSGRSREAASAQQEQKRARSENALTRLRAELLEMRFQNRQLARSSLDLNMKMQQLKKAGDLEIAPESQSLEDNAVKVEK
ncbi:PREDICTED: alanine and arginine-rich domain-containing protein [Condylura cristata]|uniref:alanine and arginine-rich domain-containing protein n=1 Tax=Condylura cristata TaxID=143302 RepID=UPI000334437A|nr:PREDICTED: alanine and arginine-rich domain-containing protein [Condylura cristata]